MIQSLTLSNFQGHKKTHMEFSPGFNLITGESNRGKSSIIRSLIVATTNRPTGASYIRTKKTKSNIKIIVSDANGECHTVRFTKKRSGKAIYGLDGQPFEGCGRDVPIKIVNALKLDEGICIQRQSEPYFLLSIRSAPERARLLASGSNIGETTEIVTESRRLSNTQNKKYQEAEKEVKEHRTTLKRYRILKQLIPLTTSITNAHKECKTCADSLESLKALEARFSRLSAFHSQPIDIETLTKVTTDCNSIRSDISYLQSVKNRLDKTFKSIQLKEIELEAKIMLDIEMAIDGLCFFRYDMDKLKARQSIIDNMLMDINTKLRKYDRCPLCGGRL